MHSLFTDGGSRGNPGPGAAGIVVKRGEEVVFKSGKYLGDNLTNNQAEYRALIGGLEVARRMKIGELKCYLDSELVVKQLRGEYRVKDAGLRSLFERVKELETGFDKISFSHITRDKNKDADEMVNRELDKKIKID